MAFRKNTSIRAYAEFSGKKVKAGTYSLFTVPGEKAFALRNF